MGPRAPRLEPPPRPAADRPDHVVPDRRLALRRLRPRRQRLGVDQGLVRRQVLPAVPQRRRPTTPSGPVKPRSQQLVVKGVGQGLDGLEARGVQVRHPPALTSGFRCVLQVEGPGNAFEPPPAAPPPGQPAAPGGGAGWSCRSESEIDGAVDPFEHADRRYESVARRTVETRKDRGQARSPRPSFATWSGPASGLVRLEVGVEDLADPVPALFEVGAGGVVDGQVLLVEDLADPRRRSPSGASGRGSGRRPGSVPPPEKMT